MARGIQTLSRIAQRVFDVLVVFVLTKGSADILIPSELARVLAIYCGFLVAMIFSFFRLYPTWGIPGIGRQLRRLAMAWLTVVVVFNFMILLLSSKAQLAVLAPFGLFKSAGFNFWAAYVYCGLSAARLLTFWGMRFLRRRGYHRQTAIIIGAGHTGSKLGHYLNDNPWMGITVAGFLDDNLAEGSRVEHQGKSVGKVLGHTKTYMDMAAQTPRGLFFIALPMSAEKKISRMVGELGTAGHSVLMVQDIFAFGIQRARIRHIGALQLMDFNLFPMWKRFFDVVFSILVLLITAPLWPLVFLAIRLEDGGPVLFRHNRVMENGQRFKCIKFRTMQPDAQQVLSQLLEKEPGLRTEWQQTYKLQQDPRVTRVGRVLRRYSLDELPQFINVLAGQMSVVGARPVVPEELETYYQQVSLTYCAMKPGITGPWQVATRGRYADYVDRVELDRQYIINCSFWLDVKIILLTIWKVLTTRGV